MNRIVNIGVLGCADIAGRSVIPSLLGLPGKYRLSGVASRDMNKASLFASRFSTIPYGSYESLLEVPGIDAVYIPLPNALHAEWIERSLVAGLHVLVEKSLACSLPDALKLNELARQKNLVLVENFQFRFHSQLQYIMNILSCDEIGELRSVRSSFGFPGLPKENDIRYQKELGGGALLDAGAYPVKAAQIFLGKDIKVSAASLNYLPGKEVDIWGGAYLKQREGDLFAAIAFGFDHHYQCSLELWGSKGRIFTNRIFTAGPGYSPEIIIEKPSGKESIILPADNHFENMLSHFHELIASHQGVEEEYGQNINQARLLGEIKMKVDEQ